MHKGDVSQAHEVEEVHRRICVGASHFPVCATPSRADRAASLFIDRRSHAHGERSDELDVKVNAARYLHRSAGIFLA